MKNINSVKSYLDSKINLNLILKDNKNKSGIYRWTNKNTNDIYIGSAVNLNRRFKEYFSKKFLYKEILKNNSIIYRALLKYGYSDFSLEVLEYCSKEFLLEKEQYYLDLLNPKYNICKKAGSSIGRKTLDSTRLKLKHA
jgi:group I intron endonuclease